MLKSQPKAVPARQVVILPDEAFFVRNVPIVRGPDAAQVTNQLELALEGLSPFPLAQLYYGFLVRPDAEHALVFAAYRRRFSTEETDAWAGAELVVPRFALCLGAPPPPPGTTWLLSSESALTALYYGDGTGVPTVVRTEALPAEATDQDRVRVREALLRALPGSRAITDISRVEVRPAPAGEPEYQIDVGEVESVLSVDQGEQLDIRDKAELAARRSARTRDRWLWRALVAGAVVLALCAAAELALMGAQAWQRVRLAQIARQTPVVSEITTANTLATRVGELSSRRLRPFEMIERVDGPRPDSVQFLSTTTSGLYTLEVQAQTSSASDLDQYRGAIEALPGTVDVDLDVQGTRNNVTTFRLRVTFAPDAFATSETEETS